MTDYRGTRGQIQHEIDQKLKEMGDQMSHACEQADAELAKLNQLRSAYQAVMRLKREILAWMAAEGAKGHLQHNGHAPMWLDYEEALAAWEEAKKLLEESNEPEPL